MQEILSSSAL